MKMSETVTFVKGSGNVFLDMGFSETEAGRELLRSNLALEVHRAFQVRKLTPTKAKDRLGLSLSEITHLENGDFERFSVERLLTLLTLLNHNVEVRIVPSEARGQLRIAAS